MDNSNYKNSGVSKSTYYRRMKDGKEIIPSNRRDVNAVNPIWKYVDPIWVYRCCESMSSGNYELFDYLLDYCYTLDLSVAINPKTYITARLRNRIRDFRRFRNHRDGADDVDIENI